MLDNYPGHLLAREPAPPYRDEGPFALWRVSEEAGLVHFVPRVSTTDPQALPWFGRSICAIHPATRDPRPATRDPRPATRARHRQ